MNFQKFLAQINGICKKGIDKKIIFIYNYFYL
jgi:hypothetical protein